MEENTCSHWETLRQSRGLWLLSGPSKEYVFPAELAWAMMLNCWVPTQSPAGTWVNWGCSPDDLKVTRAGVSMGVFHCEVGSSLALGAGELPAASMPTWWHVGHASSLLLPTQSTAGWAPAAPGCVEAEGTEQEKEKEKEQEGVSTMACGQRRWGQLAAVRRYVLETPRAVLGHSWGSARCRFRGCGLECLTQDEWHKAWCHSCLMKRCVHWELLWTPWRSYGKCLCHTTNTSESMPAQG